MNVESEQSITTSTNPLEALLNARSKSTLPVRNSTTAYDISSYVIEIRSAFSELEDKGMYSEVSLLFN